MSEKRTVLRATAVVAGATMVSRVLGFVREAIIAAYFGTGIYADAFFAAFRIPNVLRRLFGEGSLTISFIPIYAKVREEQGPERARRLFDEACTLLSIMLIGLVTLGVLFAPAIVSFIAPGFGEIPAKDAITIHLTRVMLPYALLICLVALFMGVLNAHKHFFSPAFAPVFLNLGMIGCTIALASYFEWPVTSVAVGVIVGGVAQLVLQLPSLRRISHIPRLNFQFRDPDLARIGLMMLPGMIGLSVSTLDVFVNQIFASLLDPGAVSYLYYADRLMELPQGVFAISVGTALLPSLAALAARNERAQLVDTTNYAMRMIIFVNLPASVGLFVLAEPICNVLYQRGHYDLNSMLQTAHALRFYAFGLLGFGMLRVLVPAFYALKDSLTPALVAIGALTVNLVAGLTMMGPTSSDAVGWISWYTHHVNPTGPLRHGGLALAGTLAACFNAIVLTVILRRRLGPIGGRKLAKALLTAGLGSAVMGTCVSRIAGMFDFTTSGFTSTKGIGLALSIGGGIGAYALAVAAIDRRQAAEVWARIRRRPKTAMDPNSRDLPPVSMSGD
ncbi:MAG: murein biosynthesis integral membrane protein MurJ [Deltaproteobacteria bacterium]|nr:murein biosynthesis integral membrane protein MurJ [Deltaproteobacteria bacterium]